MVMPAVGELWLISGQSNVGITLDQLTRTNEISFPPFTTAAKQAIATTTNQPNLHLFKVGSSNQNGREPPIVG
jgi:hypothetical protein